MNIFEFYEMFSQREMEKCKIVLDDVKHVWPIICSSAVPKSQIKFNINVNRIAYTLNYGASLTGVVEVFLKKAITECSEVQLKLENLIETSSIELCSIGGGPGADVIGALLALMCLNKQNMFKSVTVLNECSFWYSMFCTLVAWLKVGSVRPIPKDIFHEEAIFKMKEITFLMPFENFAKRILKNSNIILMIECSSMYPENSVDFAMHNVTETLVPGTLVIFLDSQVKFVETFKTRWSIYGDILYGPIEVLYNLPTKNVAKKPDELPQLIPQMSHTCLGMVLRKTLPSAVLPLTCVSESGFKNMSLDINAFINQLAKHILMDSVNVEFNLLAQLMHVNREPNQLEEVTEKIRINIDESLSTQLSSFEIDNDSTDQSYILHKDASNFMDRPFHETVCIEKYDAMRKSLSSPPCAISDLTVTLAEPSEMESSHLRKDLIAVEPQIHGTNEYQIPTDESQDLYTRASNVKGFNARSGSKPKKNWKRASKSFNNKKNKTSAAKNCEAGKQNQCASNQRSISAQTDVVGQCPMCDDHYITPNLIQSINMLASTLDRINLRSKKTDCGGICNAANSKPQCFESTQTNAKGSSIMHTDLHEVNSLVQSINVQSRSLVEKNSSSKKSDCGCKCIETSCSR